MSGSVPSFTPATWGYNQLFGDDDSSASVPESSVAYPSFDTSAISAALAGITTMMAQASNNESAYALLAAAPEGTASTSTNWQSQSTDLAKRIAAAYNSSEDSPKGRASTVLTSPLTDDEVNLSSSVLSGK